MTAALLLALADLLIAYGLRGLLWRRPAQIAGALLLAFFAVAAPARADAPKQNPKEPRPAKAPRARKRSRKSRA